MQEVRVGVVFRALRGVGLCVSSVAWCRFACVYTRNIVVTLIVCRCCALLW